MDSSTMPLLPILPRKRSLPAILPSINRHSPSTTSDLLEPPSLLLNSRIVDISPPQPAETREDRSTDISAEGHLSTVSGVESNLWNYDRVHVIERKVPGASPVKLDTSLAIATRARSDSDTAPQSVIYAPQTHRNHSPPSHLTESQLHADATSRKTASQGSLSNASTTTANQHVPSDPHNLHAVSTEDTQSGDIAKNMAQVIDTNLRSPQNLSLERETPSADTVHEVEDDSDAPSQGIVQTSRSPESQQSYKRLSPTLRLNQSSPKTYSDSADDASATISGLEEGFSQCWKLCNTLARLSSHHRKRVFQQSKQPPIQEDAWRSCWKLCQSLYDSRDSDYKSFVLPTLDMCRDFCQALFEARQRPEENTDSVFRVLWELQNHLYNTTDRNLPVAFHERTLEFYVTLCHRLMKQRTLLPEETENLLRACWTLAEVLFSLRENSKEGKAADEELLGLAVQACWELCDIFRKGCAQVQVDRKTPRPSQTIFPLSQLNLRGSYPSRSSGPTGRLLVQPQLGAYKEQKPPETPTTIFDDNPMDSIEDVENTPNILVLGLQNQSSASSWRWPSSVSTYSDSSSHPTSGTAMPNDPTIVYLTHIRALLVQAAIDSGFKPMPSPNPSTSGNASDVNLQKQQLQQQRNQALLTFVRTMPSNSFGSQAWQASVVERFRKLIITWPSLVSNVCSRNNRQADMLSLIQQGPQKRTVAQISVAVKWMASSEQYVWLRDLFRLVFGYLPDDGDMELNEIVVRA